MKIPLILAGVLTALSLGAPAYADDDDCSVPMSQWQSREAVQDMARAQGWNVRRIKIDDGCYEIKGYDASGREIEVKVDPATLAVVEFEYEDDCSVAMSQWQSREAVQDMARAQGWDVRRIKIDDGCYEIKGYDASGREIEVKIDPATLAVVEFEYEDDDDHGKRKKNRGNTQAPTGPVTPPSNGLFTPGSKPEVIVK